MNTTTLEKLNPKETLIVSILALLNFAHIIDFMIMMPLAPQIMRIFKITPQEFSLAVGAYTISAGVVGFISAFFVDNLDRKTLLLTGFIGFLLGTVGCALAWNYWALVFFRAFAGGFGGLIGTQVNSIVADLIDYQKRGQAMGILSMGFSMASVVGVPLGLYIADVWNWQVPFWFVVGLGIVILPFAVMIIPKMKSHLLAKSEGKKSPFIIISQILASPIQYTGILFMLMVILGHFVTITFFSPFLVANVGFSERNLTYVYVIGGALTFITSPYVGRWTDKYGKFKVLNIALISSSMVVLAITHLFRMPFYYALPFTALFFIFASARHIPANAINSNLVSSAQRGSYISLGSAIQQLGMGVASMLAGLIVHENHVTGELIGYQYVGFISVFFTFTAIILGYQLQKLQKQALD